MGNSIYYKKKFAFKKFGFFRIAFNIFKISKKKNAKIKQ